MLEYAFARDPRTGSGGALPLVSRTGIGGRLQMQFTRDPSRADLDYLVKASNDLSVWAAIAGSHFGAKTASVGAASTVSESGTVLKTVLVEDAQNPAAWPQRFLRLRITRTVATSFDLWKVAHFTPAEIASGLAEASADFNADGITNLLEYAFARDPRTGSGGALPLVSRTGSGGRLRMQFTRDPSSVDLDYIVEASNDLIGWTAIASSHFGAGTGNIGAAATVTESSGVLKTVLVEDAQNPAGLPRRFLRLKIAHP